MAFLNDGARTNGLSWITTNGTRLHLCSQEPTTYQQASATYQLGQATVTTTSPEDDPSPPGMRVRVSAVNAASVTQTGTGTHWALTNGSSVLVATGAMVAPVPVQSGQTFDTAEIEISVPDAIG